METLKLQVPVTNGTKVNNEHEKPVTVKPICKPVSQPVRVGELMKGMENISTHPQRNEILKSIFSGIEFDPYA